MVSSGLTLENAKEAGFDAAAVTVEDNYRGDSYFTDGKPSLPNQAYVALVQTETDSLRYWFTVTCDMETFGFADSKAWFSHLKDWKQTIERPVEVKIER